MAFPPRFSRPRSSSSRNSLMAAAAIRLLRDEELRGRLKRGGKATGADYSLQRERVQALQAFRRVVEWRGSR